MAHDAFICHSSEDKKIADAVCGTLEANKIRCWIAPRDVLPGQSWSSAIIEAIGESAVVVVIFSAHSNASPQVMREIERAVHKGIAIIPFRVEDVIPSKDLEYFISNCHWLDAMTPPLEKHIAELANAILALEGRHADAKTEMSKEKAGPRRPRLLLAAVCLIALIAAAGGWFFFHQTPGQTVRLENPPPGTSLVGPLLLSWSSKGLDPENLAFDVALSAAGKAPIVRRTARNSIVPQGIEGLVRWKIRPVWRGPGGGEKQGRWSSEESFTYYASSLNRIVATRTIRVGTGEAEGNKLTTVFEIELLRELAARILQAHGVTANPAITYTRRIWSEDFLRLLETDSAVDVLASAISISPEREKTYGLLFTNPTLQYPQSIISRPGARVFAGGGLLLNQIGVSEKTVNETLARKLLGDAASTGLVRYSGTGVYDRLLGDLIAEKLDGVVMDKPYALQKVAELKQTIGAELAMTDIVPSIVPGIELEKIGFAVRKSDRALLDELNMQLRAAEATRRALLDKTLPGWSD